MSVRIKLIALLYLSLLILPAAGAAYPVEGLDTSGTIVRLISFLLGMCGSTYLAASLWQRSERGTETWKYLSISMIMMIFWNIIMTFSVLLDMLRFDKTIRSQEVVDNALIILNVLDPVIEVIVFLILLFGLRKIIKAMREEPWTVFSKEEPDE
ncbi:MAG: hypothetical protein OIN66_13650 [Candidatus Methanoperedens sp.]|nr:hypothetical protein [Candidatus Methanoperedens sp.]